MISTLYILKNDSKNIGPEQVNKTNNTTKTRKTKLYYKIEEKKLNLNLVEEWYCKFFKITLNLRNFANIKFYKKIVDKVVFIFCETQ